MTTPTSDADYPLGTLDGANEPGPRPESGPNQSRPPEALSTAIDEESELDDYGSGSGVSEISVPFVPSAHQPVRLSRARIAPRPLSSVPRPAASAPALPSAPPTSAPPPVPNSPSSEWRNKSSSVPGIRRFRVGHMLAGKYRLEQMIAKGGMGCVYLAIQAPLERKVAIKLLIPQTFDGEFRRRFLLEASINARLTHRHIVTVHDYGETEDGDLFMAMEYLDGEPLSRGIARDVRLSPERASGIAIQACRALRAAHRGGVVHRDLKPSNIMLLPEEEDGYQSDFVKVLDFGLVKVFEGNHRFRAESDEIDLTRTGTMLGSPRYMAPEQIRCQAVDPRTDIYSLGVILFHMLAGRPPFIGQSSVEILNHHLKAAPPSLAEVAPDADCPPELEVIVQRCLAKRMEDRYASTDDLLTELKAAHRMVSNAPLGAPLEPSVSYLEDPRTASIAIDPQTPSRAMSAPDFGAPSLEDILTGEFRAAPIPELAVGSTLAVARADSLTPSRASRIPAEVRADSLSSAQGRPPPLDEWEAVEPSVDFRPRRGRTIAAVLLLLAAVLVGFAFALLSGPPPLVAPPTSEPGRVEVTLTSEPTGAVVWLDGYRIGTTPLIHTFDQGEATASADFVLRAEGHEDTVVSGRLDGFATVQLHGELSRRTPTSAVVVPVSPATAKAKAQSPRRAVKPQAARASVPKRPARSKSRRRDGTARSVRPAVSVTGREAPGKEDTTRSVGPNEELESLLVEDEDGSVVGESDVPVVD